MEKISFRFLQQDDLEKLTLWLNQPHVRQHFQVTPMDYLEVVGRYMPRILGLVPTECYLALDPTSRPVAYLERSYLLGDHQWLAALDLKVTDELQSDNWVLGIFLIDPTLFGLGGQILREFVSQIPGDYWIAHAHDNPRALAASRKAGFGQEHHYRSLGRPHTRLFLKRKEGC